MRATFGVLLMLSAAPAAADPCDVQTAEIVQATSAKFDHRSPSGDNVFLNHPLVSGFVMACRDRSSFGPGNVSLTFDGAYPPPSYFELVAKAAASSLRFPQTETRRLASQCHKAALASSEEMAEATEGTIHVECQSFRRDGGGTIITVWPPRD